MSGYKQCSLHQSRVDRPGRGGCVDRPSLLMEKKKTKKNAQCEFCSLTDFGGESAENKAASVQLPLRGFLVAPQVFIKLLCEKGDTSGSPLTLSLAC